MHPPLLAATVLSWGGMWAIRCAIGTSDPNYYEPATALDYLAVWTYTAALALSSVVAGSIAWLARRRRFVAALGMASAAGFAVAGVANGLEDGFAIRAWGSAYVLGAMVAALGAAAFAVALLATGSRMLAATAGMLLLPLPFLASWLGVGVLVPATLVARSAARGAEPQPTGVG